MLPAARRRRSEGDLDDAAPPLRRCRSASPHLPDLPQQSEEFVDVPLDSPTVTEVDVFEAPTLPPQVDTAYIDQLLAQDPGRQERQRMALIQHLSSGRMDRQAALRLMAYLLRRIGNDLRLSGEQWTTESALIAAALFRMFRMHAETFAALHQSLQDCPRKELARRSEIHFEAFFNTFDYLPSAVDSLRKKAVDSLQVLYCFPDFTAAVGVGLLASAPYSLTEMAHNALGQDQGPLPLVIELAPQLFAALEAIDESLAQLAPPPPPARKPGPVDPKLREFLVERGLAQSTASDSDDEPDWASSPRQSPEPAQTFAPMRARLAELRERLTVQTTAFVGNPMASEAYCRLLCNIAIEVDEIVLMRQHFAEHGEVPRLTMMRSQICYSPLSLSDFSSLPQFDDGHPDDWD